jgi:hypothetical protein
MILPPYSFVVNIPSNYSRRRYVPGISKMSAACLMLLPSWKAVRNVFLSRAVPLHKLKLGLIFGTSLQKLNYV